MSLCQGFASAAIVQRSATSGSGDRADSEPL